MKAKRYVVQCIQANRNKFGFGHNHKAGHYVMGNGKGNFDITRACIYDAPVIGDYRKIDENHVELPFEDECSRYWEEYYKYIPIEIRRVEE